jgi:hypothetical protein
LWGRDECGEYIRGLILSGTNGSNKSLPRLTMEALGALFELDRLHDVHLGEQRDASGLGRRPLGSH